MVVVELARSSGAVKRRSVLLGASEQCGWLSGCGAPKATKTNANQRQKRGTNQGARGWPKASEAAGVQGMERLLDADVPDDLV